MKIPRLRIGTLMVFVVVVAVDLAAGRAYLSGSEHFGWDLFCLTAVAPTGIVLQAAFLRLVGSRGRALIFWAGFVAGGAVAMASIIWALSDPPSETSIISSSGTVVQTYDGCFAARLWRGYLVLAQGGLESVKYPYIGGTTGIGDTASVAVLFLLPQLLIAWAGGRLALLIVGRRFEMWSQWCRLARDPADLGEPIEAQ